MSTISITFAIALLMVLGLVVKLGALSLLSGGLHFLFAKPKLNILKSQFGGRGFAFSLKWNSAMEAVKFDKVRVRLFNPFGSPTQVDVYKEFNSAGSNFARDLDMGPAMEDLLSVKGVENATIQVEVTASKESVSHQFDMRAESFFKKLGNANESADFFNEENKDNSGKPLFNTVKRSFIAEPLPKSNKALKIATNPEFAGEFAASGAADGAPKENYSVTKVWIEPGCIVCNACEGIYPEVFEVTEDSCLIRPGAPLTDGLKILEASDACPVEVIKFTKA